MCLQDLDIDFQLLLNAGTYDQLMEQLQRDCALLESLHVMDYSLLLGVHYLTWGPNEWAPPDIKVPRGAMCCNRAGYVLRIGPLGSNMPHLAVPMTPVKALCELFLPHLWVLIADLQASLDSCVCPIQE